MNLANVTAKLLWCYQLLLLLLGHLYLSGHSSVHQVLFKFLYFSSIVEYNFKICNHFVGSDMSFTSFL